LKGGKVQPQNSIFDPILLVIIVVPLVLLATILPSIRVLAENDEAAKIFEETLKEASKYFR